MNREMEKNMKKNLLFFMYVSGLILLAVFAVPHSSLSITPQDIQERPQLDTSRGNVKVEKIVVKEMGDSHATSSDGRIIRFDNRTKVFKNLNKGSEMRTAELYYVDGRLVAIYIK
jgi:hypothetical protein